MSSNNVIIGAGLAGLMCACAFEGDIYEAGKAVQQHRALLRFRDESVSKLTGIPFRAVRVHKEIWHNGQTFHACSNQHANMYAFKVTGDIRGRSIRELDTVTRYVAPDDFYQQLVDRHAHRIMWQSPVTSEFMKDSIALGFNIINTAPLHLILDMLGSRSAVEKFKFDRKPIKVARFELDPARVDIYQTIYYPGSETLVYRASITGHTMIIESMGDIQPHDMVSVFEHFGISDSIRSSRVELVNQKYGKITDLPRDFREAILYELTRDHRIFSVGRFATWRNVLLDDVATDIDRVARLITSSEYGRALIFNDSNVAVVR